MSHLMNVSIPVDLEQFVNEQIATGAYTNPEDVICDALNRLRERDRSRAVRLEQLRREIQIGIDEADRGECTPPDLSEIRNKAKATWDQQQASQ